ncbi:hypothetical protein [Priestia megaterium]|uniref:hypothetical protein n=1 Tax=Priestia megaterium TaxID=1404 RepID=UPI0014942457|nr:hypothetical protein [Priestia megaterium]
MYRKRKEKPKKRKEKKEGFFRQIWDDVLDTVIFEIVWGIISAIFKGTLRFIKHIN